MRNKSDKTTITLNLAEQLRTHLLRIPSVSLVGDQHSVREASAAADIIVQSAFGGVTQIVLKSLLSASPRDVRMAAFEWKPKSYNQTPQYLVVGAPYLSEAAFAVCEEEGIGAVDLSGNCHLTFDSVYMSIHGRKNRFPRSVEKITLSSRKTARIIRVLLNNPKRPWMGKDLAKEAQVSPAFVTSVRDYLLKQEWISQDSRNWRLLRPEGLLRAWAFEEEKRKPVRAQFYSSEGPETISMRMEQTARQMNATLAFTEFGGLQMFTPYTTSSRVTAYLDLEHSKWRDFENGAGLKPVGSGGNVHLLKPYDAGVFYKLDIVGETRLWVSHIQHYIDLIRAGERGEDAAEYLLEDYIKKTW